MCRHLPAPARRAPRADQQRGAERLQRAPGDGGRLRDDVRRQSSGSLPADFDDLQSEKAYSGFAVYGHSKLANIYFTRELARRLAGSGVSVNAVHPGYVQTELGKLRPEDREQLARAGADRAQSEPKPDLSHLPPPISPEEGAQTSIYLAMSDEVEDVSGEYFYRCEREQLKPVALDESAARRLWQVSEQLVARTGR
jgi:NAD(P)-dependent dehydrogenase (short-subunit alcohol dehydrogenase family)